MFVFTVDIFGIFEMFPITSPSSLMDWLLNIFIIKIHVLHFSHNYDDDNYDNYVQIHDFANRRHGVVLTITEFCPVVPSCNKYRFWPFIQEFYLLHRKKYLLNSFSKKYTFKITILYQILAWLGQGDLKMAIC